MIRSQLVLPDSAKPHLLQALYAWCLEAGHTPYVVVQIAYPGVEVPAGYDQDGRIVLDISPAATHGFSMADGWIQFQARFGGVGRRIQVPMAAVLALYAAETQEGMGFTVPEVPTEVPAPQPTSAPETPAKGKSPRKSSLRVIK